MSDCVKRLVEQSDGLFDEKDAKRIIDEVKKRAARYANKKAVDEIDAIEYILNNDLQMLKSATAKAKYNMMRNVLIESELKQRMFNQIDKDGISPRKAFYSLLDGITKESKGSRISVYNKYKANLANTVGSFYTDLSKADLIDVFSSGEFDDLITKELYSLAYDVEGKSVTGNQQAYDVAKIAQKYFDSQRIKQNEQGAMIGKLEGYAGHQTHDKNKMFKAGFEQWKQDIEGLIDVSKTIADGDDPEQFLKSVYNALITGVRLDDIVNSDKFFTFTGPQNLAKSVSQSRVLHFKDANSFLQYKVKYGLRSRFNETFIDAIQVSSRNLAFMQTLGTNPRAMIDKLWRQIELRYRNEAPEKLRKIQADKIAVDNLLMQVDGTVSNAVNETIATTTDVLLTIQNLSKLGGAGLSAFADIPLKALEFQYQGQNIMEAYTNAFKIFDTLPKQDRQELGYALRVGFESIIGDVHKRFTSGDNVSTATSRINRWFFKLNLLSGWTDINDRAVAKVMATRLAQMKNKKFDDIDFELKDLFNSYDIGENEWNVIRQATATFGDVEVVNPQSILDLPDEVFENYKKQTGNINSIKKIKDELEQRLALYYSDRASFAVLKGGAKEAAYLRQGQRAGTVTGMALQLIMQFKQFPTSLISKIWGRAIHGRNGVDYAAMAQLVLMQTVFGYIVTSIKDIAGGKTLKDPQKPETILASLMQGGALSIMGDFMIGSDNFNREFTDLAAGPTMGAINDLFKIYTKARDSQDPTTQAFYTLKSNMPLQNLFYTKAFFDYTFYYHIQEQLNSGFINRMEKRMKEDYNQKFYINPR